MQDLAVVVITRRPRFPRQCYVGPKGPTSVLSPPAIRPHPGPPRTNTAVSVAIASQSRFHLSAFRVRGSVGKGGVVTAFVSSCHNGRVADHGRLSHNSKMVLPTPSAQLHLRGIEPRLLRTFERTPSWKFGCCHLLLYPTGPPKSTEMFRCYYATAMKFAG